MMEDFSSDVIDSAIRGKPSKKVESAPSRDSVADLYTPEKNAAWKAEMATPAYAESVKQEIARTSNPAAKQILIDHLNSLPAQASAPAAQAADPLADFSSGDIHEAVVGKAENPLRIEVRGLVAPPPSLADQIPVEPGAETRISPDVPETWRDKFRGSLQSATQTGVGLVAAPIGAVAGAVHGIANGYGTSEGVQAADQYGGKVSKTISEAIYPASVMQPVNQAGQRYLGLVSHVAENVLPASGLTGELAMAARAVGNLTPATARAQLSNAFTKASPEVRVEPTMAGTTAPKVWSSNRTGAPMATPGQPSPASPQAAPQASVGAAGTNLDSMVANSSPALQAAYQQAKASGQPVNPTALQRHVQADSLPVPVPLTEGQATGNVHLISDEMNGRGVIPGVAERLNEQNNALKENLTAIREQAAPDVFSVDHVENGREIMDAYRAKDSALTEQIDAKYQALKDAAGGDVPVDAATLYSNIKAKLKKELLSGDAPASQLNELKSLAEAGTMTFEQYLAMRRNLSKVARTHADGNTRTAAGMMIEELEKLPLAQDAAQLKPYADSARAAAKSRFDLLDADPAYKATVYDKVAPDDFIQKFIIKGKKDHVSAMRSNLADQVGADQHIAAGTVNWLKRQAGIVNEQGNFTQAGYNKALESIRPKLADLVDPQTAEHLNNLGEVAGYTMRQERGSYVNNSNTTVSALKEHGKNFAENLVNSKMMMTGIPIPGGTMVRNHLKNKELKKQSERILGPGAGLTTLRDVGAK